MATSVDLPLFNYGIHNEASNIRAHVAPLAGVLYVFPTACAVRIMADYPKVPAHQPGVATPKALGHLVPPAKITGLRRLAIAAERLAGFTEDLSTSDKGARAVDIVCAFLRAGRFPLWVDGEFATEKDIQISGTDVTVRGKWQIEVKCDFRASDEPGNPHPRCTGRLYLQVAERNPLRRT